MLMVLGGIILGCIGLSAPAQARNACDTALQDYRVAIQSYQDGLFDPAIAGFETYVRHCPQGQYVGQAHYLLTAMHVKRSACDQALVHAQASLQHTLSPPLRPHVQLLGARCALQLGKDDIAQMFLQDAVAAEAERALKSPALYWLGELAFRQQRYDMAQRYYERALQEAPTGSYVPHVHYALGWLAHQQGEASAALQAFETLLQIAPQHALADKARFARADLLRETGNIEAAAAAFRQLAQDNTHPSQEEALFRWAEVAYQLRRYDEARTAYQKLLQMFPQSTRASASRYGLGWVAVQQQQCAAAAEPWEAFLQHEPPPLQVLEVHHQLGMCYIRLDQYAMARRHLQQVVEADMETAQHREAVVKLAALAFHEQDYAEAIHYYTQALESAVPSEVFRFHYLLAESYHAAGDEALAMVRWQQALQGPQTLPFYAQALYRLGNAYLARRAWNEAIPILRRLWEAFPQFSERSAVVLGLAQAYGQTQQCDEALPFYAMLADTAPPGIDLHAVRRARSACLFALERYAEVAAVLAPLLAEEALAAEPALLYTLGQAHMQLQQFSSAAAAFALLKRRFPQHSLVAAMTPHFAFALEKAGRGGEALTLWQTYLDQGTIDDASERIRLHLHVGRLALQEQRFEKALALLTPVREAASPAAVAEALYGLGEVWRQQRQWELAVQAYEDLLQHYPAQAHWVASARLRLGIIYEQLQEWEQALEIYHIIRETATDADIVANAQRRITAIEAGRVSPPASAKPSDKPSEG